MRAARVTRAWRVVAAAGLLVLPSLDGSAFAAGEFAVIVHPSNAVSHIRRSTLERIYRRYLHFWPDHRRVVPVNARLSSPLRETFSRRILGAPPQSLVTFWNRRYFDGVLPPPVLASPEAVRAYVARVPDAIGYIPPGYVDESVKVIMVRYDE